MPVVRTLNFNSEKYSFQYHVDLVTRPDKPPDKPRGCDRKQSRDSHNCKMQNRF